MQIKRCDEFLLQVSVEVEMIMTGVRYYEAIRLGDRGAGGKDRGV
jgi:hypothetical protein